MKKPYYFVAGLLVFFVLSLTTCVDGYGAGYYGLRNTCTIPLFCTMVVEPADGNALPEGTEFAIAANQVLIVGDYDAIYDEVARGEAYAGGTCFPLKKLSVYSDLQHQNLLREWTVSTYSELAALFNMDFEAYMTVESAGFGLGQFDYARGCVLTPEMLGL